MYIIISEIISIHCRKTQMNVNIYSCVTFVKAIRCLAHITAANVTGGFLNMN